MITDSFDNLDFDLHLDLVNSDLLFDDFFGVIGVQQILRLKCPDTGNYLFSSFEYIVDFDDSLQRAELFEHFGVDNIDYHGD